MNPSGIDMSKASSYSALVIVATNKVREALNQKKIYTCVGDAGDQVIMCFALDKSSHRTLLLAEHQTLIDFNVTSISQSLHESILLFNEMLIILHTCNISTNLGIMNGSQGFV